MIATATDQPVARSRRRPGAKSPKPAGEKPLKIGLHLSPESWRRLGIYSTMENRTQSDIVDELIKMHLKKYIVLTKSARPEDSACVPSEVSAT